MENRLLEFYKTLMKETPYTGEYILGALGERSDAINNPVIKLDQEDIEYFKNKYLPKLEEEMNEKINKIREEYGK